MCCFVVPVAARAVWFLQFDSACLGLLIAHIYLPGAPLPVVFTICLMAFSFQTNITNNLTDCQKKAPEYKPGQKFVSNGAPEIRGAPQFAHRPGKMIKLA